ncbi:MAG: hypothetical protein K6G33_03245 [Ruminococcus sp.]|uniref:hypothetical protein n=1 Tax=Ruminococcus sp. TaxID=41978 RepID=UPI0025E3CEC1|nr:hypothetical protein [Ruminococcus sp.]MCR5599745.1 hypothetical protein [Ruminococcus sp.]
MKKHTHKFIIILIVVVIAAVYSLVSPPKASFYIESGNVFFVNNSYIYTDGNKICQMNNNNDVEVIYQSEDCYSIYCDDEYIYAVEYINDDLNPYIVKLDKKGSILNKVHQKIESDSYGDKRGYKHRMSIKAIIDGRIYAIGDHEGETYLFDKNSLDPIELKLDNGKKINGDLMVSEADDMYYFYYCNNKKEIQIESIVKDDIIYKFRGIWGGNYCNGKYFINDSQLSDFLTYDLKSGNIERKEDYFEQSKANGFIITSNKIESNRIIITSNSHTRLIDKDYYKMHDCISIIDADTTNIVSEHLFHLKEQIIYADMEKVVTYYHGKYITYSVKDWKKLNSQKAPEIKKNGKYSFDTCGDYIFVFDDDTGKLLNKISIE